MGPYRPSRSLCVLMGPYISFFVLMDSNESFCVLIVPYACSWISMGPNGFL